MKIENKNILCLLALLFLSGLSGSSLFAQADLIASWSFNGNGTDFSGNGYDATLRGDAIYSDDAAKGSRSLLLDGNGDYARVDPIDFGNQFTICAWVFLEPGVENIQTIIGNATGGSTIDGFKLFVNNWETSNKRIIIEVSDGVTRLDAVSPENTFEEGFWNHVAVTMDREAGVAQIFYNAAEVTESGAIVPNFQITDDVTIGAMNGPDWYWAGMIDDVRIYNWLMTADDIDDVMNSPETRVHKNRPQIAESFELSNYPNPFNPQTTIRFNLLTAGYTEVDIFNVHGDHVRTLLNEQSQPGQKTMVWDGLNDLGQAMPSGAYLCRVVVGDVSRTSKMLLIR